jgi:hypothetical protein
VEIEEELLALVERRRLALDQDIDACQALLAVEDEPVGLRVL